MLLPSQNGLHQKHSLRISLAFIVRKTNNISLHNLFGV